MKAFILAAGVGSRLRPITDTKPKALVEVAGKPMIEHVITRLKRCGFDEFVVNVHHFGTQITDFLRANNNFGVKIAISDETEQLLDTGGAIRKAAPLLKGDGHVLVHNVDILSNCNLRALMAKAECCVADAMMVVSERTTSRYLLFDNHRLLHGWVNKSTGQTRPAGFEYRAGEFTELAYSGIQVISQELISRMEFDAPEGAYSIVDYYLNRLESLSVAGYEDAGLHVLDIGKPDTLVEAELFLNKYC